ncbi:hypothetical protein [Microbaculum marinum]|uniref:Uncharacterized protein n=1 Tax=Microbaculum marinum TaxID=1764581 RepID=A0AAW9RLL7_9HYPH
MIDIRSALVATAFLGLTMGAVVPASAQTEDCDTMIGQINELLKTAELTDQEKEQVYQLRDQGMAEGTRAGGDCTSPLQEALQILQQ